MQGDATNFNDVKKLINFTGEEKGDLGFTDPPYGINRVHKDGSLGGAHFGKINTYKKVIGDENNSVGLKGLKNLLELTENQIVFGGNYFSEVLPSSQGWEVWDKQNDMEGNDFADCELAWTSFNKRIIIHRFKQNGMIRYGNRKEELLKRIHPNQKLVCLIKDIIVKRKLKTKNIIDIFAGSGSILIAAEELKIPCFCLEIDKEYVEAIAKRWEEFTGQEREVIEDGE
jgi:site-specific DNA-methyltransferase (adenine-specific)